ncbi:MAG: SUF system NifU family Fe-S cluster assembly protein [Proteobacteria bacterium]|nr:SUF system NifU family Fe-S cluster assembly protein [Pseudomonadota bacterium]
MDDELRELYQEVILDHGKNPRNFRAPEDANYESLGHNPLCGDRIKVFAKVNADGLIEDAAFDGRGCAISVASASMMTDIVKGKTVDQVDRLFATFHDMCTLEDPEISDEFSDDIDKLKVLSGVRQFPMRVKCATLAWHTINAAVHGEEITSTE